MLTDRWLLVVRTLAATISSGLQVFIVVHILNLGGSQMGTILSSLGVLLLLLLPGGFVAALLIVGFQKLKGTPPPPQEVDTRCKGDCNGSCYKEEC